MSTSSKPGRRPKQTTAPIEAPLNEKAVAAGVAARDALSARSLAVAERYADGVPYERERVVAEAKFLMAQSAEAMLEAGKRLIQIKENELHGDFLSIVTDRLGLAKRSAQRMMSAAVKYLSPKLGSKAPALALLGRAKLFDLMVEDEDDIAELADGGTIAGLALDDMQAMTQRELKKALAEARGKVAAQERLLEARNKKIDELQSWQPRPELVAKTEEEQKQLEALREATNGAEVNFMKLANVAEPIMGSPRKAMRDHAAEAIRYLAVRLAEIIDEHGIEVSLAEAMQVRPAWLSLLDDPDITVPATAANNG